MGTYRPRRFSDVPDGTSNTAVLGENYIAIVTGAIVNTAGNNLTTHGNTPAAPEGYAPWWWGAGNTTSLDVPCNPTRGTLTMNTQINNPLYSSARRTTTCSTELTTIRFRRDIRAVRTLAFAMGT